jgi:hypothetical protein
MKKNLVMGARTCPLELSMPARINARPNYEEEVDVGRSLLAADF